MINSNKLIIVTANFGMNYGYINSGKKVGQELISKILDLAWINNIDTIDTAEVYGESEIVLGNYFNKNKEKTFKIITKINSTESIPEHLIKSLANLQQSKIYGVLVHSFENYKKNPELIDHILKFKKNNNCEKIGFSLYYPEELQFIIENKIPCDIVQIAYSIFDRRFEEFFPILNNLGIEIHVRSVFLQGLFFANTSELGLHFDNVKNKIKKIQSLSKDSELSIASICLNFVNCNKFIDKIVIGVNDLENLQNNISVLSEKELLKPHIESLKKLSIEEVNILFPHFWKL